MIHHLIHSPIFSKGMVTNRKLNAQSGLIHQKINRILFALYEEDFPCMFDNLKLCKLTCISVLVNNSSIHHLIYLPIFCKGRDQKKNILRVA